MTGMFGNSLEEINLIKDRLAALIGNWNAGKDELTAKIILSLNSLDYHSPNDLEILISLGSTLPPDSSTKAAWNFRMDQIRARYKFCKY